MKKRLDTALVELGFFESRNQAVEAIKAKEVFIDGKIITKASFKVDLDSKIEVVEKKRYVSRAAWKLKYYLEEFPIALEGKRAIDIGSSTGGFSEVLLEGGVKSLDCVDVGSDQLHPKIRASKRVRVFEKRDIRDFKAEKKYEVIVSDVSFISLRKILNSIDNLTKDESEIILLFKPQFEVGKDAKRDKKGVVVDSKAIQKAKDEFEKEAKALGWRLIREVPSKQKGKEGNLEYIYHFKKERVEN